MTKQQIFKKAHQAAARCVETYRLKDVMLKPPVPEKFIEVSDARGCVTRYGFDGYYGALAVRFLTSECRISMRQDRLEEFSKLSFYDEIKATLDEHIESVSALIY